MVALLSSFCDGGLRPDCRRTSEKRVLRGAEIGVPNIRMASEIRSARWPNGYLDIIGHH